MDIVVWDENVNGLLVVVQMIFPWVFDEMHALKPFKDAAHLLAEKKDWPPLYDVAKLNNNKVKDLCIEVLASDSNVCLVIWCVLCYAGSGCCCCLLRRHVREREARYGNDSSSSGDPIVDHQRIHAFWSERRRRPGFGSSAGSA